MEHGTAQRKGTMGLLVTIGVVAAGAIGYSIPRPRENTPIIVSTPPPTSTPLPTSTLAPLRIYVSGEVHQPGVFRLPPGSIVEDAIHAAGGPLAVADLDAINLALELDDQQQLYVPREGQTNPPAPVSGGVADAQGESGPPVNINTATPAELEVLPGIGPARAQDIVAYREAHGAFARIEDIQDVSGIGVAIFEGVRDVITVGP